MDVQHWCWTVNLWHVKYEFTTLINGFETQPLWWLLRIFTVSVPLFDMSLEKCLIRQAWYCLFVDRIQFSVHYWPFVVIITFSQLFCLYVFLWLRHSWVRLYIFSLGVVVYADHHINRNDMPAIPYVLHWSFLKYVAYSIYLLSTVDSETFRRRVLLLIADIAHDLCVVLVDFSYHEE